MEACLTKQIIFTLLLTHVKFQLMPLATELSSPEFLSCGCFNRKGAQFTGLHSLPRGTIERDVSRPLWLIRGCNAAMAHVRASSSSSVDCTVKRRCEGQLCAVSRPWARALPRSISLPSVFVALVHFQWCTESYRGVVDGWEEKVGS